ncbi:MAG: AAA family ATPase [Bacteroidales bacterium]|nr:AAA family ATPase [Bacteroidales bacterium]
MINELLPSGYNPWEGIIRKGAKTAVVGGKSVGKSFFMLQLGMCLSQGADFLGYPTEKTGVLYINAETMKKPLETRIFEMGKTLGLICDADSGFTLLNARGRYMPIDELVTKLIESGERGFGCVMIDPVWHFVPGDEESTADIDALSSELDRLCDALNCSVIFSHTSRGGLASRCAGTVIDLTRTDAGDTGKGIVGRAEDSIVYRMAVKTDAVLGEIPGEVYFDYPVFGRK